jgi:hypothetical protein
MYEDVMTMLDLVPEGYKAYKHRHGCHFNRELCEFAVSRMKGDDGKPIKAMSRQEVERMLEESKITIEHLSGYDHVFVANMGMADYLGDSVPDMEHLAKYVKNVIDDPDGYEGIAFCRWLADCVAMKVEVPWEEVV